MIHKAIQKYLSIFLSIKIYFSSKSMIQKSGKPAKSFVEHYDKIKYNWNK